MSITGMQVDFQELDGIVKAAGMGISTRQRGNKNFHYLYKRVPGGPVRSIYLCPDDRVVDLTERLVKRKISELNQRVSLIKRGEPIPPRPKPAPITPEQVLEAMGTGSTLAMIAERLGVSTRSVRLKEALDTLKSEGRIRVGRWYEPATGE